MSLKLKLISATPSPYARKVRIALAEKGIPFELQTEVPWNSTTQTPDYNPLEKLPVLIFSPAEGEDEHKSKAKAKAKAVYESHFILEWIEAHYAPPQYVRIYPEAVEERLLAKQVEVVADGVCDACVLLFFEKQRDSPSQEWMDRQLRKVAGGLKALDEWVGENDFIVGDTFSLADVAAGAVLGYMKVRFQQNDWQTRHPNLKRYSDKLEERESFKNTVPSPQMISDKIV